MTTHRQEATLFSRRNFRAFLSVLLKDKKSANLGCRCKYGGQVGFLVSRGWALPDLLDLVFCALSKPGFLTAVRSSRITQMPDRLAGLSERDFATPRLSPPPL